MKTHTAVDELKRCLGNIERFDEQVNAFITVLSDTALEEAQQADEEFAGGGGKRAPGWCPYFSQRLCRRRRCQMHQWFAFL